MRRFLIILLLLVIIGAIVLALSFLNREEPFEQSAVLYNFEDQGVQEIHIVSSNGDIHFIKKQGQWAMVKPKAYALDQESVIRLENRLKDFLAARILDSQKDDLAEYGLDSPATTIDFRLDDGTEHTLYIGDITASNVQYYAKDSAIDDKIFVLGSYDVENFASPVTAFRDRNILNVNLEEVECISMDVNNERDFCLNSVGDDAWRLSEPLETEARGDAVYEMLTDVQEIRINGFIDEAPEDLRPYGLETPAYTLSLADADNTQTLYFGELDEDTQVYYMMVDDSQEVFSLSTDAFDPRRFKIANFLNEAPLSVSIDTIKSVTITEGDSVMTFVRDNPGEDAGFTYLGKPVNLEYFTTLYVNIMSLTAEGYDETNPGSSADIAVVFEYLNESSPTEMALAKRDDLTYFITLNGTPKPFYIGERKVDLVKWWRDKTVEGF